MQKQHKLNEPHHEKTAYFAYAKAKAQISCVVTCTACQRLCFRMSFFNPKFQVETVQPGLYSPVCAGHGRKPQIPVFSNEQGENNLIRGRLFVSLTILDLHSCSAPTVLHTTPV